ncbi:DUF2274 domain-containing protein [Paremcibacter congregatus]|uniref:Transposase n=1 Tax=Paremcibacter congregatus TaxID=2043170 RepID=A0A2G4YS71_9PROT|nr:DUF2274 domain-containing protein [Paremcibacter congregatus]PHZ85110.1 transposase [Paremcibacter congregatus]QDE27640.1 DUF2274 domain-containing protein [Paremcibacter congregatus]
MHKLKLGPLPNRTPVKLTVSLPAEIFELLTDYARVFEQTYGAKESCENLIPYIVEAYIKGDSSFNKGAAGTS